MDFKNSTFGKAIMGAAILGAQVTDFLTSKKDGSLDADGNEREAQNLGKKRAMVAGRVVMGAASMFLAGGAFAGDGGPGGNVTNAADAQFAGDQNSVVLDYVPDGGTNPPAGSTFNMGSTTQSFGDLINGETSMTAAASTPIADKIDSILGGDASFTPLDEGPKTADFSQMSKFGFQHGDIMGIVEVESDSNHNGRYDLGDHFQITAIDKDSGEKIVTDKMSQFDQFVDAHDGSPSVAGSNAPEMADQSDRTARQAIERGFDDVSDLKVTSEHTTKDGLTVIGFQKGHFIGEFSGEAGPDGHLHENGITSGRIIDTRTGAEIQVIDVTDDSGVKAFASTMDGDTKAKSHLSLASFIDTAETKLGNAANAHTDHSITGESAPSTSTTAKLTIPKL